MKKIFRSTAVALLLCVALLLSSCSTFLAPAVVNIIGKTREYRIQTTIHALEIDLFTARLTVCEGDSFCVVTNHNLVEVVDREGVLSVYEMPSERSTLPDIGDVTVYLPQGMTFATAEIYSETGDASISSLRAQSLWIESDVGALALDGVCASDSAALTSEMGSISLAACELRNATMSCTVGMLDATDIVLTGNASLTLGVGAATLALRGNAKDYTVSYVAGTGSAMLDGEPMLVGESYGKGASLISVESTLGALSLTFTGTN